MRCSARSVRGILGVLVASIAAIGSVGTTYAAENDISVGGVMVCTITHDASGYTADQRVNQVRQRITTVLSTNGFRGNSTVFVRVRPAGQDALIWVGDKQTNILVFTVTPADTIGTSLTPVQLARQWAPRLAQGLSKAMPSSYWNIPGHVYLF